LRNPEVNRLSQGEGEKGFYRLVPKEGSEVDRDHRWALSPISVISDIGLSSELGIGTSYIRLKRAESNIISDIGTFIRCAISDIPLFINQHSG
jgi:hypothetical protein